MGLLFLQYRLPGKRDFITIEANEHFQYRFGPNSRGREKFQLKRRQSGSQTLLSGSRSERKRNAVCDYLEHRIMFTDVDPQE